MTIEPPNSGAAARRLATSLCAAASPVEDTRTVRFSPLSPMPKPPSTSLPQSRQSVSSGAAARRSDAFIGDLRAGSIGGARPAIERGGRTALDAFVRRVYAPAKRQAPRELVWLRLGGVVLHTPRRANGTESQRDDVPARPGCCSPENALTGPQAHQAVQDARGHVQEGRGHA